MVDGREGSCFVSLLAVADDLPDRCKSHPSMSGHGEDDSLGARDFCNFAAMGLPVISSSDSLVAKLIRLVNVITRIYSSP